MNVHNPARIALVLLVAVLLSACSIGTANQAQEVAIHAADNRFTVPTSPVAPGAAHLVLHNDGTDLHHAQLARLNEGVSFEQFTAALQQSPDAVFPLITFVGGPATVSPGSEASVTLDLLAGHYALLDFLPGADGVPHIAKGMVAPLTVTDSGQWSGGTPKEDITISMRDFHYTMPTEVKVGPQVWKVVNDGVQPHELVIFKLAPNKTPDDVFTFLQKPNGPPPFTSKGGMQGLQTGLAGWVHLDLEPGAYVAICMIPDPQSGNTHAELGMMMAFTAK